MSRGRRIAPGLYRMPDGRWFVRIATGPRDDVNRIFRTFDHRADAEDFLRAYKIARSWFA